MKRFSELFFMPFILSVTILMLLYPQAAYEGACRGLSTWSVHLLPSLLPFFIAADLLLSLGVVRFLGIILEPVMRPVFRLPGETGFALALGFTSGFPMGAVLTASLKEQNLCTAQEAARLAAFTNNSSPLFLLISVPVSMLHRPELGILLLAAHYLANLTIGILLRFLAPSEHTAIQTRHLFRTALLEMRQYQISHQQPVGAMLGQAVQKGIDSIVKIGGFVLLFSVVLSLLQASSFLFLLDRFFSGVLTVLQITPQLSTALSAGLFEMTLGAQAASQCPAALLEQLMIISFILGWSGLSIQAQVSSILAEQNISSRLYCLCRPIQGLLAALYLPMLIVLFPGMLSAHTIQPDTLPINPVFQYPLWLFPCAALLLLLALSAGIRICKKVQQGIW